MYCHLLVHVTHEVRVCTGMVASVLVSVMQLAACCGVAGNPKVSEDCEETAQPLKATAVTSAAGGTRGTCARQGGAAGAAIG